jgi:hypothetical protein
MFGILYIPNMALPLSLADVAPIEATGPGDDLLTVTQAAALVNCTVRNLERYWSLGRGPARTRIAGRVFVSRAALAAWIDGRATTTKPMAVLQDPDTCQIAQGRRFPCQ